MRYIALACDYDGTIADHGEVDKETVLALERFSASGRKLILVTGREFEDLLKVFPDISIFDYVVAENGAMLYKPSSREEKLLCVPPPPTFIKALMKEGVSPVSHGRAIVSTVVPHETTAVRVIRQMGLELQLTFNKGAIMILPTGVNKATGLRSALKAMGLSPHNVVGVGDAENDHALMMECECAVAVANALTTLKQRVDFVTTHPASKGVQELMEMMIESDLVEAEKALCRHDLILGTNGDGKGYSVKPYGSTVLISGPSGSGKSTVAHSIIERLAESAYQFCLIDPEGDYQELDNAVSLGNSDRIPAVEEILQLLRNPKENAVVNLLGMPLADRPGYFAQLLPHLQELRTRTGRPHWLILDEAHHLMPSTWTSPMNPAEAFGSTLMITVHPDQLPKQVLTTLDLILTVGPNPEQTMDLVAKSIEEKLPEFSPQNPPSEGMSLAWCRDGNAPPKWLNVSPPRSERKRHRRKYAEGDLGPDRSFVFQGPEKKLNLRAQNLTVFMQMADGVDDETWLHHLRNHDYSSWFKEMIKDDQLATKACCIEDDDKLSAKESREAMHKAIDEIYAVPRENKETASSGQRQSSRT